MKTVQRILLTALMAFMTFGAFAQLSYGFKFGVHYNDVSVPSLESSLNLNPTMVHGLEAGAFLDIPLIGGFSFRPELSYVKKGFKVREGLDFNIANLPLPVGVEASTNVQYIQMPLMGKFSFGQGPAKAYILGGPVFSYALDARLKTSVNSIVDFNISNEKIDLSKDTYQRAEVSAMGGLGVELDMGNGGLFIEGRYNHSFTDMLNDPVIDLKLRNRGFGLSVGYKVGF